MSTVVNLPAESATAEPNFNIESYSPAEYQAWESTGKIPDVKPASEPSAEETPVEEDLAGAPVEGDEPAAESAPAVTQEQPKGKGAEKRKAELAAEIQDLLRKRAELKAELAGPKQDVKVADPSPASEAPKIERPTRPVFGEPNHKDETWAQFELRNDAYIEAVAEYKAAATLQKAREADQQKAEQDRKAAEAAEIDKSFRSRIESAKGKHADFAEVAFSPDVPISSPMDGFIRSNDAGAEVLYYLGQHVDEAQAIAAMPPYAAVFALSKIALSLDQTTPPVKAAPVAPITKAARPATDLRATGADQVNELQAAVEAGDVARFEELMNRRDVERRKKG